MQALSRPLLLLSVATSLANRSDDGEENPGSSEFSDASQPQSDSLTNRASESRVIETQAPEKWMLQLFAELEKEGIVLPERITEDDLRRLYHVANGDFSSFFSSVKRTINWRRNFRFMSVQELEEWSEMVFWHGCDVKRHPCLIIRVQSACSYIMSGERYRLPEVVVSQIEYGILHLVRAEDPLITVLMDCQGLSPFGFPVHMMRSCAVLLQDHYPNRLAALFVVRLPPIARVIAQTLFQVLRPATRRKLRIFGDDYQKFLSEHLQTLPSFLGGDCSCPKCSKSVGKEKTVVGPSIVYEAENVSPHSASASVSAYCSDDFEFIKCDKVLKSIAIGLLLVLLYILLTIRFHNLEGIQLYTSGW
ncbi:sec14 cytosolic factor isoform X2 [Spinacia oleracea]|nr:sec14 cytosolic factor-like isoform X2 [Spinacia oleracea]XP_021866298.1 sec14 cytosolic factor-like isoform X2 [Spinacia oleracea]